MRQHEYNSRMTVKVAVTRIVKDYGRNRRRTLQAVVLSAVMAVVLCLAPAAPISLPAVAGGGATGNASAEPAVGSMKGAAEPISPADAAARIAKERADAESRRSEALKAEAQRKAKEAENATAEAARSDAMKRAQAEELARRKAESDKKIAEELQKLKQAREEADRAKAASPKADAAKKTFERSGRGATDSRRKKAGVGAVEKQRCASGRIVYRKGRRWYVTGADDTLWHIARKFYGAGSAYPRIYRANRKKLVSPHVVRPCLSLRLPGLH